MFWPIVIAALIMLLAYLVFHFGPDLLDFGKWFSVVIIGFLLLFAGAAAFVIYKLPSIAALGGSTQNGQPKTLTVPDVIVND